GRDTAPRARVRLPRPQRVRAQRTGGRDRFPPPREREAGAATSARHRFRAQRLLRLLVRSTHGRLAGHHGVRERHLRAQRCRAAQRHDHPDGGGRGNLLTNRAPYLEFFGLNEAPFPATADPSRTFPALSFDSARAALVEGITERRGLLCLVGEAGTGKTLLLRTLLEAPPPGVRPVMLLQPGIEFEALVEFLALQLGRPAHVGAPRKLFTPGAVARIARLTEGVPRRVNMIADASLTVAWKAGARPITEEHVNAAWESYAQLEATPAPGALLEEPVASPVPASAPPPVREALFPPPTRATTPRRHRPAWALVFPAGALAAVLFAVVVARTPSWW